MLVCVCARAQIYLTVPTLGQDGDLVCTSGFDSPQLRLLIPEDVTGLNILPRHCRWVDTLKVCSSWCSASWGAKFLWVGLELAGRSFSIRSALEHQFHQQLFFWKYSFMKGLSTAKDCAELPALAVSKHA